MNWDRYIDKRSGEEVMAKQWFGINLRVIFKDMIIPVTEVQLLKFQRRGFFFLKSKDGMRKIRVMRGDWIIIKDKLEIHSFNTELFNRIFVKK